MLKLVVPMEMQNTSNDDHLVSVPMDDDDDSFLVRKDLFFSWHGSHNLQLLRPLKRPMVEWKVICDSHTLQLLLFWPSMAE